MACASPATPLSLAVSALEGFSGEERDNFFAALDELPNVDFDSPVPPAVPDGERYDIEEDDWKWLATQVSSRTHPRLTLWTA